MKTTHKTFSFAAVGCVALSLATAGAPATRADEQAVKAAAEASPEQPNPWRGRLPNVVLKTHEGKTVRFYDDLLKGKIVCINYMYATCKRR